MIYPMTLNLHCDYIIIKKVVSYGPPVPGTDATSSNITDRWTAFRP